MARILFVAVLAMCLVCMLQASPMPDQAQQPSPLNGIETAIKQGAQTLQQSVHEFVNDPTVQQLVQDGVKLIADGAEAVRQQAEKLIPKTQ